MLVLLLEKVLQLTFNPSQERLIGLLLFIFLVFILLVSYYLLENMGDKGK